MKLLRRFAPFAALAIAAAMFTATSARAVELNFESLSTETAINFARDAQQPIGYITTLQIAGTTLASDLTVIEPTRGASVGIAGALSSVRWPGGPGDPIEFTVHISTANKQLVSRLLRQSLTNTSVAFDFIVYQLDPQTKKYFPSLMRSTFFSAATPLQALLAKDGKDLAIALGENATAVQGLEYWTLSMKLAPQPISQPLEFAMSSRQKSVKRWGIGLAKQ